MFCPECDGEFVEGITVCPDCKVDLVAEDPDAPADDDDEARYRPPADFGPDADRGVVLLRTGQLWEADLAASALEDAGIPYYRRTENAGGLTLAMPLAPSVFAGQWWTILVPAAAEPDALAVLDELPLTRDLSPGVVDFAPEGPVRNFWRTYAWAALVAVALSLLFMLLS